MKRTWMGAYNHWAAKPTQIYGSWPLALTLCFKVLRIHVYHLFIYIYICFVQVSIYNICICIYINIKCHILSNLEYIFICAGSLHIQPPPTRLHWGHPWKTLWVISPGLCRKNFGRRLLGCIQKNDCQTAKCKWQGVSDWNQAVPIALVSANKSQSFFWRTTWCLGYVLARSVKFFFAIVVSILNQGNMNLECV